LRPPHPRSAAGRPGHARAAAGRSIAPLAPPAPTADDALAWSRPSRRRQIDCAPGAPGADRRWCAHAPVAQLCVRTGTNGQEWTGVGRIPAASCAARRRRRTPRGGPRAPRCKIPFSPW